MRVDWNVAQGTLGSGLVSVTTEASPFATNFAEANWKVFLLLTMWRIADMVFLAQVQRFLIVFAVAWMVTDVWQPRQQSVWQANNQTMQTHHTGRIPNLRQPSRISAEYVPIFDVREVMRNW